MTIPTTSIHISLASGTYNVMFSVDAERPQDLIVRDESNIIVALADAEIAQLYAVHHFLHDLGNDPSNSLGGKLFKASEQLTTMRNTLLAQHDVQFANGSDAEKKLERAEIDALEDIYQNTLATAGLSIAQAGILTLVGISAAPATAISATVLVLSSALELLDAQLSKSKATEVAALSRHVMTFIETALGQEGARRSGCRR